MQVVRRAHVDDVELSVGEHLFVVGVASRLGHQVSVAQQLQSLLVDVGQSDQFHPVVCHQHGAVPPFGDATTTDDSCS